MIFTETKLPGAFVVEPERREDGRGFFARGWCQREFNAEGLVARAVQTNISNNRKKGTLRGMHYQIKPYEETKLVRCTRGAIYDVIVDLRPASKTHRQWFGVELTQDNYKTLYVPAGFAHGFQTLEDNTDVLYQVSQFYVAEAERGARFDDPAFGIVWPLAPRSVSEKDRSWPDYDAPVSANRSRAPVERSAPVQLRSMP